MLFTSFLVLATVSLAAAFHVHPDHHLNLCLAVDIIAESAPVHIRPCHSTPKQQWFLNRGVTRVTLGSTNFCLDVGFGHPGPVIKTCDNSQAQNWVYKDDNSIVLDTPIFPERCLTRVQSEVRLFTCELGPTTPDQIWTTTNSFVPDMEMLRDQGDKSSCS